MATATAPKADSTSLKNHFLHLTPGKLMGLRQITDQNNKFKVFALDQSNSFKKALRAMHERAGKPAEPTYHEIRDVKLKMVSTLAQYGSAVLLDVNYGARQCVNSFALPHGVGLIVRSEASKDPGIPSEYEPGWSVEKIKKMGASAVKLLIYMDVDDKAFTKAQLAFLEKLEKACAENDILLMTEELTFPRKGEEKSSPEYQSRKIKNIMESTKLIGPRTDILKLEFPGDIKNDSAQKMQDNLGKLNEAAIRPWVLLSAGEKFDLFLKQVELSMKAGCGGYMAGRAIFNEYFEQQGEKAQDQFLLTTAAERMKKLNQIVDGYARPWTQRYHITAAEMLEAVDPNWYNGGKAAAGPSNETKGAY